MISPMLLKSSKTKELKQYEKNYIAQEKLDGNRIIITKKDNLIYLQTRSGKNDLSCNYPEIVKELLLEKLKSFILDGELVFYRKDTGKSEFLTSLSVDSQKDYNVKLMLFDVLESDGVNLRNYDQCIRSKWIYEFVNGGGFLNISYIPTHTSDFDKLYSDVIERGGEGLVLKKKTAKYQDGKRSSDWLKVKKEDTADVFIIGLSKGEGKYEKLFGAVIMGQYDSSGNITVVGNCSGFDDATRALLYSSVMKEPRFDTYTSTKGEEGHILHKVKPLIVIEISFMERLESGMFRHPRFERIRTDKTIMECIYEGE